MASSYTPKEIKTMVEKYTDNPCLEVVGQLSVLLNRPKRSIISKLVKEGVYERRGYRTKLGEVPKTKLEYVREIEDLLDVTLPGLDKSPKTTLKALAKCVSDQDSVLESTLEDLASTSAKLEALQGMVDARVDKRQAHDPWEEL